MAWMTFKKWGGIRSARSLAIFNGVKTQDGAVQEAFVERARARENQPSRGWDHIYHERMVAGFTRIEPSQGESQSESAIATGESVNATADGEPKPRESQEEWRKRLKKERPTAGHKDLLKALGDKAPFATKQNLRETARRATDADETARQLKGARWCFDLSPKNEPDFDHFRGLRREIKYTHRPWRSR